MDKRKHLWKKVFDEKFVRTDDEVYSLINDILDVKFHVEDIYSSHSSEKERLHSCAYRYVCKPDSSWEHLTSLLYEEDEMTAVDQARPFLPPRG